MISLANTSRSLPKTIGRLCRKSYCAVTGSAAGEVDVSSKERSAAIAETKAVTRVNKLNSGLTIASCEELFSPASKLTFAFRAGSRYETSENSGLTHFLRAAAGASTEGVTGFGLVKQLSQEGATLSASTSRDHMLYTVECRREQVEQVVPLLYDVLSRPAFNPWDRPQINDQLRRDLALYLANPVARLMEAVHEAAYRGGLARSVFMPPHKVDSRGWRSPEFGSDYNQPYFPTHTREMCQEFVSRHYTVPNLAVCGVGVSHEFLSELLQLSLPESMQQSDGGAATSSEPSKPESKFSGGNEVRVATGDTLTHVALVTQGSGLESMREALVLDVLAHCLTSPAPSSSPGLQRALSQVAQYPVTVRAINVNHSDSGLFGFHLAGNYREMHTLCVTLLRHMVSLGKVGVSAEQLERGKSLTLAGVCHALEGSRDAALHTLVTQSLQFGRVAPVDELHDMIHGMTGEEVNAALKRVVTGRQSMAAVGDLEYTPHVNDLIP